MNRIFTITPGRSGIHWLSAFVWTTTNLPHTAKPEYFPEANPGDEEKRRKILSGVWDELPEEYLSTSLIPKNGYLEALASKGARFVHLVRPIMDNAYSWYRQNGIPGRTARGLAYHPIPNNEENEIVVSVETQSKLTDFQLCVWLCMEVRARAARIAAMADVYEMHLYDTSVSIRLAEEFLKWSGFEYDLEWWLLVVSRKINESHTPGSLRESIPLHERLYQMVELSDILLQKVPRY